MAVKGLFLRGFTLDEIKSIQSKAKAFLLEGKTIMSWSDGGGTSVSKQFTMPITDLLEECAYALAKLEPSTDATSDTPPTSVVAYRLPL